MFVGRVELVDRPANSHIGAQLFAFEVGKATITSGKCHRGSILLGYGQGTDWTGETFTYIYVHATTRLKALQENAPRRRHFDKKLPGLWVPTSSPSPTR